ncbi:preprotein translocase subunit YajC [Luteibacter jiangsuensis]|jgi:preprotein translocase subunit YajC|uniref:Sec translocon accessory complex subunit YajC n=1 Tax=Luteibacter jiangsuensis TaxID=637577 RepID=A0ABX0Q0R3_9GAMM|nr:preprotein translocase subunit YajC [Luteibacter jiangsuensis]NID04099.1 preprotein translocase subunit YajC [Luteibacter jiangsuensis]
MSLTTFAAVAQAAAPAAGAAPQGAFGFSPLIMMVVLFGIFYFMMIRPQMKRQKEHRALLAALAKGDEVVMSGGMAGRIEDVGESFVRVEIAPGTVVQVQKGSITQVLPKGTLKKS